MVKMLAVMTANNVVPIVVPLVQSLIPAPMPQQLNAVTNVITAILLARQALLPPIQVLLVLKMNADNLVKNVLQPVHLVV